MLISGLGAFAIARWGEKLALLDRPNHRSSHRQVTPKGGGLGILVAFVVSSTIFKVPLFVWIPAAVLSLVSFLDDKYEIGVWLRLIIQFSAATIFLVLLEFSFPNQSNSILPFCKIAILSIFVVGTANCYNFMDGINGIAGITGIVGFGLLGFYGLMTGKDYNYVLVCLTIVAACFGFLPFNFPNARVFMGDIGSVLLGFLFACIIVLFSETLLEFVILVGFLFLFYADEAITTVERVYRREKLMKAHRSHLYQILANEYKISHWKIALCYGAMQLIVGLSVWGLSGSGLLSAIIVLFFYTCCFVVFSWKVKSDVYSQTIS
jgi:Fuc2NAc and GlcNAc transferase